MVTSAYMPVGMRRFRSMSCGQYNLPHDTGVGILNVGSEWAQRIRQEPTEEDVLIALGDQPVVTVDELHKRLTELPIDVPASVVLLREGRRLERLSAADAVSGAEGNEREANQRRLSRSRRARAFADFFQLVHQDGDSSASVSSLFCTIF